MGENLVITKNILVVFHDQDATEQRREFTYGQVLTPEELAAIPAGKVQSMRQTRVLLPEHEVAIDPTATAAEATTVADEVPKWQTVAVGELGLEPEIVRSLTEAGLMNVADVLRAGVDHDGSLSHVKGIGKGREKQIQEAIAVIAATPAA